MTLMVHTISGAPRAWRILLGLAFKGLDYNIHYLEASKGEHKSPAFLKINPRGTVPVLETDGLVLTESIGILAWLDRHTPDRPLFGVTPAEAAAVWQITMEASDYLRSAVNAVLRPILVLQENLADAGPEKRTAMETASATLHAECRLLEDKLAGQLYLVGDHPSAADAVAFPEIRLIQRAIDTRFESLDALGFGAFPETYPRLTAWMKRISDLPGVQKTFPYHWQEQEQKQSA